MSFATYAQIKNYVERAIDIEDEVFIQKSELMDYCNQAIHEAESIILKMNEDYFKTKASLNLVVAQADYDLPSDIYADKIRRIIYSDGGTNKYTIKRLRKSTRFEDILFVEAGEDYAYDITNSAAAGRKITFYPTPAANETATVIIWYIRNAKLMTDPTATITETLDIPEFRAFIEKYMIMKCMAKEGHPGFPIAVADFESEKQLMIDSLSDRVPDDDNTVEMDLTHYLEHS